MQAVIKSGASVSFSLPSNVYLFVLLLIHSLTNLPLAYTIAVPFDLLQ